MRTSCRQEEIDELVSGLLAERRIRDRIDELKEYRAMGIRTMAEAADYESDKKKRDVEAQQRKQRESAAYLYRCVCFRNPLSVVSRVLGS